MQRMTTAIALVLCTLAVSASAQTRRPKIGLALSGGGAKGCAHVGVLRQLEAMHVPVDYIAGTSMGSIVGALYASGMTPDEIEKELVTIDWSAALSDATAFEKLLYRRKFEETRYPSTVEVGLQNGKLQMPSGIRTGQKLSFLLFRYLIPHLDQPDFTKLPIPFAAVATDLETGDPFVLDEGDLAEALRASMSIPGAFTPVDWKGHILVDGGVSMNVPVDVVRAMGADIVIAVDIAAGLGTRDKLDTVVGVVGQLSSFLTRKNMERQLANADLVLSPDIRGFEVLDFSKAAEIVKRGDTEALAKKDQLLRYAIDPAEHETLVKSRYVGRKRDFTIDSIRVEGVKVVDERFVLTQMQTKPGDTLDLDKLQKDVEWMYGWGDFTGIHAGLDTADGKNTLVMRVQEKPWGPSYLRTGIGMETRYNQPSVFLLLAYTKRWLNDRGAEWRTDLELGNDWGVHTEWYQPRGYDKYGFVAARAGYEKKSLRLFAEDAPVSQYEVRQLSLHTDAGIRIWTAGEVRLGLFARKDDADIEIGNPDSPSTGGTQFGLHSDLHINTTNAPFFPIRGTRLRLELTAPLEGLGSDEDFFVADLRSTVYGSKGRHVFTGGLYVHDALAGDSPVFDSAILGGLANLSGYPYGSLIGQTGVVVSAGYRNRVSSSAGFANEVYAGLLAEAGDAYGSSSDFDASELKTSGTVYLGLNTAYGPVVLAASKTSAHRPQYYLQIGRSF